MLAACSEDATDGSGPSGPGATEGEGEGAGTPGPPSEGEGEAAEGEGELAAEGEGEGPAEGEGEGEGAPDPGAVVVAVPLGETLFMDGDDYLAPWGIDHPAPVHILTRPEGAEAELAGGGGRLTPDLPGRWELARGEDRIILDVQVDQLGPDTFLNYNYTPVTPIALAGDGIALIATPTSNAVQRVRLGAEEAEALDLIPTGAWPTSVAVWPGSGYALIAQAGRDSLGFLDLEAGRVTDAIRVGNEPANILVDADHPDGPVAYVSISGADEVAKVDLEAREVVGRVPTGRDPRAMALDSASGRLFVVSVISLNDHRLGQLDDSPPDEALQHDIAVIDTASFERTRWIPEVGSIIRGLWIDDERRRLVVAVSHSNNEGGAIDADSRPHSHALAVVDIDPDSETVHEVIREVDLDRQPSSAGPAPSPFSMAPTEDGSQLLVTLSAGSAVLALDPETYAEIGRFPTGHDPRGLVHAAGRAWTYAWLDNRLEGIPSPIGPGGLAPRVELEIGRDPTPADVKAGQRLFNEAAFSKHGDFSCNNCHIDGLTDGLVWDLLVDGHVNTIAFRNVGGTGPFLWGGQLPTLFDFSREVLRLVGAEATGQQMEQLTTYMQSVTAPPNPHALPGGALSAAAKRGKVLFEGAAGCMRCHNGPLLTSRQMVDGKTPDLKTDVPALIGVYDTAPYGREGQWVTLEEMVAYAVTFTGAELSAAELEELLRYVQEIPGDALYLNSARPLNGDDHVAFDAEIELTFSEVLAPGQEASLIFEHLPAKDALQGTPLAGTWETSGRVARFAPDEPLELETHYRIGVAEGLRSSLGRTLYLPLDLRFRTGSIPETDVSGRWIATFIIVDPIELTQDAEIAFLQSTGGRLTGVLVTEFEEGTLDHIEGLVSGHTMVLQPFLVDTQFGEFLIDGGEVEMVDEAGDGFADSGEGTVTALGFGAAVRMRRISLPDGVAP